MGKVKNIAIRILFIMITITSLDGGHTLSLISNDVYTILFHNHIDDIELQHHHHTSVLNDDEKWIMFEKNNLSTISLNSQVFLTNFYFRSQDFSESIWQPPRFI